MLPCTFPLTTTLCDWTLPWIFPLPPTISVPPCDEMSPCRVPSNVSSFENRIVPLISTPFKMLFFSPESVITISSHRLTKHRVSARFMHALYRLSFERGPEPIFPLLIRHHVERTL